MAPIFNGLKQIQSPRPEAKAKSPKNFAHLEVEARIRLQALGIAPTFQAGGRFKNTLLAG